MTLTPKKAENMDTITIKLAKPIMKGEGDKAIAISELSFREATAGDACRADAVQGEFIKLLAVLSGMAGVDIPTLQKVPLREMTKIIEKVSVLMGEQDGLKGGST